jgi:hypothetical protein
MLPKTKSFACTVLWHRLVSFDSFIIHRTTAFNPCPPRSLLLLFQSRRIKLIVTSNANTLPPPSPYRRRESVGIFGSKSEDLDETIVLFLLQDQAAKEKALQTMSSMSSAQIVSATALHNKTGLSGLGLPAPVSYPPPVLDTFFSLL